MRFERLIRSDNLGSANFFFVYFSQHLQKVLQLLAFNLCWLRIGSCHPVNVYNSKALARFLPIDAQTKSRPGRAGSICYSALKIYL